MFVQIKKEKKSNEITTCNCLSVDYILFITNLQVSVKII